MTMTDIIDMAESLPFVKARLPYGPDSLTYEIEGKQFCLIDLSAHWNFYNVKTDPELSEELRERYPSIRPGFHMNKRHWNSVDYAGLSRPMHEGLLRHAYLQTIKGMPKRVKIELFGSLDEFDRQWTESVNQLKKL